MRKLTVDEIEMFARRRGVELESVYGEVKQ